MVYDHTELKKQFNEEYAGNDRAIKNWQMQDCSGKWCSYNDIKGHKPVFYSGTQYRRNPEAPPASIPHVHAANMLLYAQDSQTSESAWKQWQHYYCNNWVDCEGQPHWYVTNLYRRKPVEFVPSDKDECSYRLLQYYLFKDDTESYDILYSKLSEDSKNFLYNLGQRKPVQFVPTKEDQLNYLNLVRFCLRSEGELYRRLFSSLSQQSKDYFTNNTKNPYALFPNVFKVVD